jgi:hypothetical protein
MQRNCFMCWHSCICSKGQCGVSKSFYFVLETFESNKYLFQWHTFLYAGAHTIGCSHCAAFSSRLYNFSTTSSQDPSLHPSYADAIVKMGQIGVLTGLLMTTILYSHSLCRILHHLILPLKFLLNLWLNTRYVVMHFNSVW